MRAICFFFSFSRVFSRIFSVPLLRIPKILMALICLCFTLNSAASSPIKIVKKVSFPSQVIIGDTFSGVNEVTAKNISFNGIFESIAGGAPVPASDFSLAPGPNCPFGVVFSGNCTLNIVLKATDPSRSGQTIQLKLRLNSSFPVPPPRPVFNSFSTNTYSCSSLHNCHRRSKWQY